MISTYPISQALTQMDFTLKDASSNNFMKALILCLKITRSIAERGTCERGIRIWGTRRGREVRGLSTVSYNVFLLIAAELGLSSSPSTSSQDSPYRSIFLKLCCPHSYHAAQIVCSLPRQNRTWSTGRYRWKHWNRREWHRHHRMPRHERWYGRHRGRQHRWEKWHDRRCSWKHSQHFNTWTY